MLDVIKGGDPWSNYTNLVAKAAVGREEYRIETRADRHLRMELLEWGCR